MDEYRNRGSPRLLFSKEELEKDATVQPAAKAEKTGAQNGTARKKLKKRYAKRPSAEDAETIEDNLRGAHQGAANVNVNTPAADMTENTDTTFAGISAFPGTVREGYGIRQDSLAPGVLNTRQRPQTGKNANEEAAGQNGVQDARNSIEARTGDQMRSLSSKDAKTRTMRLKFEETQTDKNTGKGTVLNRIHEVPDSSKNVKVDPAPVAGTDGKKNSNRLKFEDKEKKPSRLVHSIQEAAETASDQLHRKAAKANEDDNVAVDAVLQAEQKTESALRMGEHAYHAHTVRHHRQTEKAEKRLEQANTRELEKKNQQEHPQFSSNPYSRWRQKRAIRQEYAAAKRGESGRSVQRTARNTEKAAEKASDAAAKTADTIRRHPTILLVLALGVMLLIVMSMLQSCSPLAQSILESLVIGTYPAEEEDVRAAERVYAEKERALQDEMEHYERFHPGYDEYQVDADEIWHNPYVLIAIISAYYDGQEWDIDKAMPVIETYFALQYEVTETVTTQTRYHTENGVSVPYPYTICQVKLENKDLSHLPILSMSHHTMGMYALYMASHGNMDGIFHGPYATPLRDPMLYDIPPETLAADPTFARLMEEATKYVGYPYIWGGSDPETSFDCSGFISYVFTASGVYNTGRLGATGLRNLCRDVPADQVRPGDIVFFQGTMGGEVSGITHCGIYVGNHMMIHCGSPLGYANLDDAYWQQHFHSFGRIPY